MSPLPVWVQYVQALGLPIFSAVLALVGGWVGWQNMQVTRVKLQYDLYDRRYKVLEAVRELVRDAAYGPKLDAEAIRAHAFTAGEVGFLFDDDLAEFVEEVKGQVSEFRQMYLKMRETPEGSERNKLTEDLKLRQFRLASVASQLITSFKPLLVLPKIKTFPWL